MKINITMVTANKALITPFVSNLTLCALSKREFRFSAGFCATPKQNQAYVKLCLTVLTVSTFRKRHKVETAAGFHCNAQRARNR